METASDEFEPGHGPDPDTPSGTGSTPGPAPDGEVNSIERTLEVITDRWTLLILRSIFTGHHRFTEIQTELGVAKNLLSLRLARLVEHDVLQKVVYCERPLRHEYRLTEKGRSLAPALIAFMHWGDRWYAEQGAPTVLVHSECSAPVRLELTCDACQSQLDPTQISSRPGPGADHPDTPQESPT